MKNFLLSIFARTEFQPFWRKVHRVSIGGLGFGNPDPNRNGENRFLANVVRQANSSRREGKYVVFDLGANEGNFTAEVLERIQNVEVHCFEPNPRTFKRLQARFAGDSRVILNELAVGDVEGTLTLYDYSGSSGSEHASLLKETFQDFFASQTQTDSVRVITVDTYLAERAVSRIDFFKVDVEGLEHSVFAGMQGAIDFGKVGIIQFEFNLHNAVTGLTLYKIARFFKNHDMYRLLPNGVYAIKNGSLAYNPIIEIFKYSNYALIPAATRPGSAPER
jgi:FkbM family methyltransferase